MIHACTALLATGASAQTEKVVAPDNWHGFIEDQLCASCHSEIASTFQTHGMARSFAHASRATRIETIEPDDAPSFSFGSTNYRMTETTETTETAAGLLFSKWQTALDGNPIHSWQRKVDWVMGSGAASRVYLVQAADGTLYQLPLAWYSQHGVWAKTPGTSHAEQEGGLRLVRRECMFCHTAVPTNADFDDRRFAAQSFPKKIPEGIGCQRCHGPGAQHAVAARKSKESREGREGREKGPQSVADRRDLRDALRATIVNPARLPAQRRRDICAQCHHQPAVAVFGQRRFDQNDYQFTAGHDLANFLLKLEVHDFAADGSARPPSDRFEINHHAYRLEQSSCFTKSAAGALECTSCHDPHRKPERSVTLARTKNVCLACHSSDQEVVSSEGSAHQPSFRALSQQHLEQTECVTCHMPRRRTEDIVRVVMTDHKIQRQPEPEATRLAARTERIDRIADLVPLDPSTDQATPFDDAIRATAGLRLGSLETTGVLERLVRSLEESQSTADLTEAKMRLAQAHLRQGRLPLARRELAALISQEHVANDVAVRAREWLAVVAEQQARNREAERLLTEAIALSATQPAHLYFNRALVRGKRGDLEGSCEDFESTVQRNEFLVRGWFYVGLCRQMEDPASAVAAYQRALSLDPKEPRAVSALVAVLESLNRPAEALRVQRNSEPR